MIGVTIISVGKIKDKFFADAVDEYKKRLKRYCNFEIIEVKDEPTPENPSDREKEIILMKQSCRGFGKRDGYSILIILRIR